MDLKLVETTRRETLALAAIASLAAFLAPKLALADEQTVAAEIKKLYGDKKFDCGKASASTRMRLAQTQNVICIAEMSNGNLHMAKTNVKVTIGGCGG